MHQVIVWRNELSVGREDIDEQHKKLVSLINWLSTEITHDSHSAIGQLLGALVQYTVYHFGYEERLIEEGCYPQTDAHKKEHQDFIEFMVQKQQAWEANEQINLDELGRFLRRWVIRHICGTDKDTMKWIEVMEEKRASKQQTSPP